ncbi:Glycolipid transfer protein 3 [Nymphaea thermarum]|nr:Glycolipid transfer protein 3 [Nymphaea thermarum]
MIKMKSAILGGQLPKFIDPPQMDGDNKAPVIQTALDAVRQMRSGGDGCRFSTLHFLTICNSAVTILDKIGPTMRVLRQDLRQNIEVSSVYLSRANDEIAPRLQMMYKTNPSSFSSLTEMVKKEIEEGSARKPLSCTRAVLWLTRSMDFVMSFLSKFVADADRDLVQIIEESYSATLQPWHGWISSAAYKVALKLIPERKVLMNLIMEEREDHGAIKEEINSLVSSFTPILNEIHAFLATLRLDRLKSS